MLAVATLSVSAKEYAYQTVDNDPLQARIYTLDNGLTVYLSRNAEKPEIQTFIAVRAGAQNDPLESTGLAHYQEHIMFKGTTHYGTTNYAAEKPNLDAIDSLYEVYGKTTDPDLRKAIYHQIDSFSYAGSKIAIANEFDKLMSLIGATGLNAFTSTDKTCYHEVIPAGELRRWAMIESDRFQNLVVRGFHTELEAVYEEFNMYSTMDYFRVNQAINTILFPDIPYRQHTVLGTQEHLKSPSLKNIKHFYDTYYRPNNVAICLSGDLDYDATIAIVDEYFGAWQPNPAIPQTVIPVQKALTAPKDTVVYGKEAAQVWLAWTMPAINHADMDAIDIMSAVLQNGKCGLLDLDLIQAQNVLGADAGLNGSNDYSTFLVIGEPKQGQDLQQVRQLLLDEVTKLKQGQFSEQLLKAIIANYRRQKMESFTNNRNRTMQFVSSFIYQIPYADIVSELDRLEKITKDDIIRVANLYLGDNYACIYKQQREDEAPAKVDKPAITPIEMNRDKQSDYVTAISTMTPEPLQPQYLDFDKDLSRTTLKGNQQLLYRQNTENDLFYLTFIAETGTNTDPAVDLATDLIQYLGTTTLSAEQYQVALYSLAGEINIYNSGEQTVFQVSGLQENFPNTLGMLEDKVLNNQPNDAILKALVADIIKAHNDEKSSQEACFGNLRQAGIYGLKAQKALTLTPCRMNKMKAATVMQHLLDKVPAISHVFYYGPASESDIVATLNANSKFIAQGNPAKQVPAPLLKRQQITQSEVWLAPYKANNIYLMQFANWGETYSPKDEAIIRLFNEYFGGSMGSIVFQEMRESRALCYASGANYGIANNRQESNYFMTYILSQNDKMKDCLVAFDSICNNMPMSQSAFDQAKVSLIKQMQKRRYVRATALNAYYQFTKKGWDHDWYEDIYRELQNLTLDDVVAFQKQHVANRTYRYLILGNEQELDMNYLKSLGKVKKLKTKDIFVY